MIAFMSSNKASSDNSRSRYTTCAINAPMKIVAPSNASTTRLRRINALVMILSTTITLFSINVRQLQARRAFDARARKSGYKVVNLNCTWLKFYKLIPFKLFPVADMIYETMNRAGSVFKVIDRNSGNRLIMKRLKTRCSHSACLQEEDAWNLINARISRMSKYAG